MRLLACLLAMGLLGHDARPLPAPPVFVSDDKGLTFRSPAAASYCPLGKNWVGSDHGTVLFLTPPSACGRATAYASSGRNFRGDPPLISVYYGLWLEEMEKENPRPSCVGTETVELFGKSLPVCEGDREGKVIRTVWTRFWADGSRELSVMLRTTPERANADLATLRQFLTTFRTCSTTYRAEGKLNTWGEGPACPKGGLF